MSLPTTLNFVLEKIVWLLFIYLTLSFLIFTLQEALTNALRWRASHLREAIEVLMAGGSHEKKETEKSKFLTDMLYEYPLIKPSMRGYLGISYMAPEIFSASLLEQLGVSKLTHKLAEVRLEKFSLRILGDLNAQVGEVPLSDWNKGKIRLIAEQARKDLTNDTNFATLVGEYADILHDFTVEAKTLEACVERMGESLDAYIANYPLLNFQTAEPSAISTVSAEVSQSITPQSADTTGYQPQSVDTTGYQTQPEPLAATSGEDLLYFAKRLRALKLSLFGTDNERALVSGGLRPSLSEIAQLVDESSTTHQEVAQSYNALLEKAVPLEAQVNPGLEQQLLESYPEAIEKVIVQAYPETVEEQLLVIVPNTFQGIERQLTARRRKTYRVEQSPQANLLKQQKRTLHKALGQLTGEQRQQVLSAIFNQFGGDERANLINKSLDELSNEQRYVVINIVFATLGLTNADFSVYDDYQTYKTIQKTLAKLPNFVKYSFSILAKRAESKVVQDSTGIDEFRKEIEIWFDRSMERAAGVFKRNAQRVSVLLCFLIALSINADTLRILNGSAKEFILRSAVFQAASEVATKRPDDVFNSSGGSNFRAKIEKNFSSTTVPLGWRDLINQKDENRSTGGWFSPIFVFSKFLGLISTSLVVSSLVGYFQSSDKFWGSVLGVVKIKRDDKK